jgi:hypothetical protein
MSVQNRTVVLVACLSALAGAAVTAVAFRWVGSPVAGVSDRADTIHEMGSHVMPFALHATTHVFEMTESGGIQDVVVKDAADSAQIPLIRQHLKHEAAMFGEGNFSDPMSLHGAHMPGVHELSAAAGRVRVTYDTLPDGARITFSTDDPALVTAVHRWFGAQLSDHGADATYR